MYTSPYKTNIVGGGEITSRELSTKTKHGPTPDRLKIKGLWDKAVGKALKKKHPDEGWPDRHGHKKRQRDEEA